MNYKIEIQNQEQANEAEKMAATLGYEMDTMFSKKWSDKYCYLLLCKDMSAGFGDESMASGDEPMSMTELRALVSLHKNPINMDKVLSEVRSGALGLLDDKPMKEYLNKLTDGTYKLVALSDVIDGHDGLIEIPEGAEVATKAGTGVSFWRDSGVLWWGKIKKKWCKYLDLNHHIEKCGHEIIWQRAKHPEELPFVDDEPSLNDQYAEIEQVRQESQAWANRPVGRCVYAKPNQTTINAMNEADASIADTLNGRQSTYGSFEDVALTTQKIMDAIAWARGQDKLPAPHHEALHMIASKMARIVNGDHNHKDSWHDIAGYATLVERLL